MSDTTGLGPFQTLSQNFQKLQYKSCTYIVLVFSGTLKVHYLYRSIVIQMTMKSDVALKAFHVGCAISFMYSSLLLTIFKSIRKK